MKYLLDTNICAYFINRTHPSVADHIQGMRAGQIGVSAITWAELWHGAERGDRRESAARKLAVGIDQQSHRVAGDLARAADQYGPSRAPSPLRSVPMAGAALHPSTPERVTRRTRSKRFSVWRIPGIHDGWNGAGSGTATCHSSMRWIFIATPAFTATPSPAKRSPLLRARRAPFTLP